MVTNLILEEKSDFYFCQYKLNSPLLPLIEQEKCISIHLLVKRA